MKNLNMLVWLTQLGLSVAGPLAGFILLAVWLRQHFELGGWHETKVVRVFCLFTFVCCVIAYLSVR